MVSLPSKRPPRRERNKLPKLPNSAKVQKRPLLHAPIPSPFSSASTPKVVYVKHSTPFMSAVRRVRSLLHQVDKRSAQSTSAQARKSKGDRILAAAMVGIGDAGKEEVIIKGSGRAVEKVLGLAAWFGERQEEEGIKVRLQTGSVWAIDDIVIGERDHTAGGDPMDEDHDKNEEDEDDDIPESRMRQISVLEAKISLR